MHTSSTRDCLEFLTVAEAARLLHRKPWPLLGAIRRGELVAYQPSGEGAWLIRPKDLRTYVEVARGADSPAHAAQCSATGKRSQKRSRMRWRTLA